MTADPDAAHRWDTPTPQYDTVEELLAAARAGIDRLSPGEAAAAVAEGARLVDIRPAWQRSAQGEIPGALIIERNHLEWRLHPASDSRVPQAGRGQRWIVVCSEGYTSSLAAHALSTLGIPAVDLEGGFGSWRAAGLPTSATVTAVGGVVGG